MTPAIKKILWMGGGGTFLILGGWAGFGILLGGVTTYGYSVSYPAAVYTEDGKRIVFLEHRSISWHNKLGTGPTHSKTYLGVMDKDGRGKRVVGEWAGFETGIGIRPHRSGPSATYHMKNEKFLHGGSLMAGPVHLIDLSTFDHRIVLDRAADPQWIEEGYMFVATVVKSTTTRDKDGFPTTERWIFDLEGKRVRLYGGEPLKPWSQTLEGTEPAVRGMKLGKVIQKSSYFFRPPWWRL